MPISAIDEEDVKNLRQALQGELPQRQFGLPLRLEVAANCPMRWPGSCWPNARLTADDLYRCAGPVNIVRLASMIDEVDIDSLKFAPFIPGARRANRREHGHPRQPPRSATSCCTIPTSRSTRWSNSSARAADDPDVVAIKQTVYRTGANSVLMEALIEAAQRGKEVTVVVELMARFDEEANINWAEKLEEAGAQVVYGVFGLKTHAKMALRLRRENDADGSAPACRYAHLGTGNYHPRTTRLYTDFGLLTAIAEICADINEVFLHLTSLARRHRSTACWLAPFTLHEPRARSDPPRDRATRAPGKPARIIAKMNALLDEAVIEALYEASQAGVQVDLIVRGACALRPGVPGVSENIRVRSILGRFLEHHRVWYFEQRRRGRRSGCRSADWMGRNFFRRIEVAFPVRDPELKARVIEEGIDIYLRDNCDAWRARRRRRPGRSATPRRAHALLLRKKRCSKRHARRRHSTPDAGMERSDGPDPVAALRSRGRRARPARGSRPRASSRRSASRDGSTHDCPKLPDHRVAGRARAADRARARPQVQDPRGELAPGATRGRAGRRALARRARSGAGGRSPAHAGRNRGFPAGG